MRDFAAISVGDHVEAGPTRLSRDAILHFARAYDPQAFHLDAAAGRRSLLGGLAASGWQTALTGMRMAHHALLRGFGSVRLDELSEIRWLRPVFPDEPLCMTLKVTSKQIAGEGREAGRLGLQTILRNGVGESVFTQRCLLAVGDRYRPPARADDVRLSDETEAADLALAAPYDTLEIGRPYRLGRQHFSAAERACFADALGGQEDDSAFALLSDWHAATCWMRHFVGALQRSTTARHAAGLAAVAAGPSPGINKLRCVQPIADGDLLHFGVELKAKRVMSDAGTGLLTLLATGHKADGSLALQFELLVLWPPVAPDGADDALS